MSERPTALIVNDDPSQVRLIGAVLDKAGLQPRGCGGVEEALTALAASPADLIVTDLHMPGIDGWQFCQLLRSPEYAAFNAIPILVVSATFSGSDAEQLSLDLGANAFLAAPFAPSALQDYARALLAGRHPEPTPRVLVVHGDAAEAERVRAAFAAKGYVTDIASGGAEALRLWHARHPDVAVIDDRLTDPPAAAVLAEIKRPGSRTVAFAICSDVGQPEGLRLARYGADGSVAAPADVERLLSLCAKVRRQRSLLRIEELLEERGRALRDSEARWRSLFEAIPEIVVVHDEDGVIRHINRTGAEQLEWPAHELIGRSLRDFELAGADDGPAAVPNGPRAETVYVARSGRQVAVEVNRRRMHFEGQPAILSVAHDVSAQRELGRQRQTFLAMLTHDIKNPLAIVLGFTELLGEIGPLTDDQSELVTRMQANANTVLALVANYLNLTQIESGSLALNRKPLRLADVVEAVVAQYHGQAARQSVALTTELDPTLGVIQADMMALERVLTNLLHNALKFTPDGGAIVIRAQASGDSALLQVTDTGIGIPPEEVDTVFQIYRRGMTRQPREGVGLGLYIAQSLVHAHQGEIAVESTVGRGTTFSIHLPAGEPTAAAAVGA
ncbi:MAG: ATP-binding protein [Candidatus Binatia bacterium]